MESFCDCFCRFVVLWARLNSGVLSWSLTKILNKFTWRQTLPVTGHICLETTDFVVCRSILKVCWPECAWFVKHVMSADEGIAFRISWQKSVFCYFMSLSEFEQSLCIYNVAVSLYASRYFKEKSKFILIGLSQLFSSELRLHSLTYICECYWIVQHRETIANKIMFTIF